MKKIILTAAILACSVSSHAYEVVVPAITVTRFVMDLNERDKLEDTPPVIVQSSGTGETCEKALSNAKRYALEKVSGSWVHSIQSSTDGKYNERIVQYSGGVIKSYKYLRNDCTFVIIEAEVMKRSNKVQLESLDVSKQNVVHLQGIKEHYDRKAEAIKAIDSRLNAVWFKPEKTDFRVVENTSDVAVVVKGKFAYTDKFRADYLALREEFGYFNLPAFAAEPTIVVTGFDSAKAVVYKKSFFGGEDWKMWKVRTYGATRTMEIYTNKTDEADVRFRIPLKTLEEVRSFVIEVI